MFNSLPGAKFQADPRYRRSLHRKRTALNYPLGTALLSVGRRAPILRFNALAKFLRFFEWRPDSLSLAGVTGAVGAIFWAEKGPRGAKSGLDEPPAARLQPRGPSSLQHSGAGSSWSRNP